MSKNDPPMEVVKIRDPRINVNQKKRYAILEGAQEITQKAVPNQGTASFTSLNWTAPPPSPQTVVDPLVWVQYPVQINFAGTTALGNLLQLGTNDGLRSFPMSSIIGTVMAKINGQQVSYNLRDYINTLSHMHSLGEEIDADMSSFPFQRDSYQDYGDWQTYGNARNPLCNYGDNPANVSRGAFPINVISNTPTSAVVQCVITEPLILSPFYFSKGVSPYGMCGIQSLEVQVNFDANIGRIWSHSNALGNNLTSVVPSFTGPVNLLFNYLKLKEYMTIPRAVELPYFYINNYPSQTYTLASGSLSGTGLVTPGASLTVQLQNVQLSTVPEKFMIWARQQNSDQTYNSSDAFAAISQLNLQWDVKSGLFASATQSQLWRMSRDNGSDQNYVDFVKHQGGILVGIFGKDVGLDSHTVPSSLGTWNFQPQVTITNMNLNIGGTTPSINYTIFMTMISEGVATIMDNSLYLKQGVVSRDDIRNALNSHNPYVDYNILTKVYGGDFFSSLKSVFNKALPYIEKALPVAKLLLGAGKKKKGGIVDGYDNYTYEGSALSAGAKKKKAKKPKKAGAMSGGVKKKKARKTKKAGAMSAGAKNKKVKVVPSMAALRKLMGSGLYDDEQMEAELAKYY